jgi:hypothetical protein
MAAPHAVTRTAADPFRSMPVAPLPKLDRVAPAATPMPGDVSGKSVWESLTHDDESAIEMTAVDAKVPAKRGTTQNSIVRRENRMLTLWVALGVGALFAIGGGLILLFVLLRSVN